MELLDIVDENGNYTGEVMEREKVHDLCLYHWEIAIFIVNNKKQILLQKRAATKRFNPNKWGLCAGHVDSGENIEVSALRELEEEVGIKLSLEDLKVLVDKETRQDECNYHVTRYFYVVCNTNEFKIQEEEVSEVKWYDIKDVIDRIKNKDDSLVLENDRLYLVERLEKVI